MSYPDAAHLWQNFFGYLAGAAATLTGLLFVAISLRPQEIATSDFLKVRAANGLIALMGVVITSLLMLIPVTYARWLVVAAALVALAELAHSLPGRRTLKSSPLGLRQRIAYDAVLGVLVVAGALGSLNLHPELAFAAIALGQLALVVLAASAAWLLITPHQDEEHLFDEGPDTPRPAPADIEESARNQGSGSSSPGPTASRR